VSGWSSPEPDAAVGAPGKLLALPKGFLEQGPALDDLPCLFQLVAQGVTRDGCLVEDDLAEKPRPHLGAAQNANRYSWLILS
jgi:hypothetical protein